jgi:hypothetical protein
MKKQMKRTVYEAPRTERLQVQLEAAFCAGSADVENPNKETGKIEEHQTNQDFSADFGSTNWD